MAGYGFVRSTDRWGVNSLPLSFWQQQGITPLFQATDPNLGAALSNAPGAGVWLAAANGEDPRAYAQRLAAYANRYHPSIVVPDIEFVGKGYQGSAGWNWNDAMMSLFRALAPNQRFGVSVMPNQQDFNYGAYRGASTYLPQAYGATYATKFNPADIVNTLVRSGVPQSLIQPVLAPGQSYGGGPSSRYALDDFGPNDWAGKIAAAISGRSPESNPYWVTAGAPRSFTPPRPPAIAAGAHSVIRR